MARNTKEKAQETRERIIDAATDVFYENGVSNTSLNGVAQAAGVTRGAIYWHFKNKADLFDAMCNRVREPIYALVEEVSSEKTTDPLGQLLIMGSAFRRSVVENHNFRKVMTIIYHRYEATDADDPILLYQRDWLMHTRESTKRILANAIAKNQLPHDLDLRLGALMLQTTFSGLMSNWLLMPDSFDLVDDANIILNAALDNMRTNPALRKKV
ncbi:MAG: TetR family transcriptional regulator [Oxalobacter sp.]|nr:MAG: TetR family transcriptional regulator [Oxalobacter sp.]